MKTSCKNIYRIARENADLSRERAAEILNVSVRSLADYERDVTVPNEDIVLQMVEAYDAKWLGYQHFRLTSELGRKCLPEIDPFSDLARSVLKLQKEISDIKHVHDDMIEIACDGLVDQNEKGRWLSVTKEVDEMAAAAFAVMFAK